MAPPPVDLPSAASAASSPGSSPPEVVRRWRLLAATLHRNPDLTKAEVRALRRQINELARLHRRWASSGVEEVRAGGVTVIRRPAPWRARRPGQVRTGGGQNWAFDPKSRGRCPACYAQLPHDTFERRKYHNLMVRVKVPGLKKAWARMRAGTHRPWEVSNALAHERGLARRAAAFAAEVPRVAERLGAEKVREIVQAYSVRHGYVQFRQWVRCHYGEGPRVRPPQPAAYYGCVRDARTGRWLPPPASGRTVGRRATAKSLTAGQSGA